MYADSLHNLVKKRHTPAEKVYNLLTQAMQSENYQVIYEDAMQAVDLNAKNPEDREAFEAILSSLSEQSAEKYGCMMSAVVHLRETNMPPSSFFALAEKLFKQSFLEPDLYHKENRALTTQLHAVSSCSYYA